MANLRLEIELLDWSFNTDEQSLEIHYFKGEMEKEIRYSEKDLLQALDKSFLIDSYQGNEVKFSRLSENFTLGEHRQREHTYSCSLCHFMDEIFEEDDALRLIHYHEDNLAAKRIADQIHVTIKRIAS